MELTILARFGELPDDPRELVTRFLEADWIDKRRAKMTAGELAGILGKMFRK